MANIVDDLQQQTGGSYSHATNSLADEAGKDADKRLSYLANFGATIQPSIIAHATGAYIFTESGEKVLDRTSGQVSILFQERSSE